MMGDNRISWFAVSTMPLLALLVSAPAPVSQAQSRTHTITVNEPRPLAAAILVLEKTYGWIITYEDPPFEFTADFRDVTEEIRRSYYSNRRVLGPRGGRFNFSFSTSAAVSPQPMEILEQLLSAYHTSGNSGEFRLLKTGSIFHVLPDASNDVRGFRQVRTSRLNVRITIEERKRTAMEMFDAIVRGTNRPGEYTMTHGTIPTNLLANTWVTGGARNEIARNVLLRTLAATGYPLSWRLLCDPGPAGECSLNVHDVQQPSQR